MEKKDVELLDEDVKVPKKNSIGIVLLVIVLMVGCLVGGYFINEANLLGNQKEEVGDKEKEKKEEKEPVVTNYAVTDEKVVNLIDNLLVGFKCQVLEDFANDKKVEAKDIDSSRAYRIAEVNEFYDSGKESISLEDYTSAVRKYLGKDYVFNPTDINEKCIQYTYDVSTKTFNRQETACGGTCGPTTKYRIIKAVDTDGVLVLDTKVIFASLDEGKDGYYSDYQKTNKLGDFDSSANPYGDFSKGSDYQFTFKLEDGNYVFVSSEPKK